MYRSLPTQQRVRFTNIIDRYSLSNEVLRASKLEQFVGALIEVGQGKKGVDQLHWDSLYDRNQTLNLFYLVSDVIHTESAINKQIEQVEQLLGCGIRLMSEEPNEAYINQLKVNELCLYMHNGTLSFLVKDEKNGSSGIPVVDAEETKDKLDTTNMNPDLTRNPLDTEQEKPQEFRKSQKNYAHKGQILPGNDEDQLQQKYIDQLVKLLEETNLHDKPLYISDYNVIQYEEALLRLFGVILKRGQTQLLYLNNPQCIDGNLDYNTLMLHFDDYLTSKKRKIFSTEDDANTLFCFQGKPFHRPLNIYSSGFPIAWNATDTLQKIKFCQASRVYYISEALAQEFSGLSQQICRILNSFPPVPDDCIESARKRHQLFLKIVPSSWKINNGGSFFSYYALHYHDPVLLLKWLSLGGSISDKKNALLLAIKTRNQELLRLLVRYTLPKKLLKKLLKDADQTIKTIILSPMLSKFNPFEDAISIGDQEEIKELLNLDGITSEQKENGFNNALNKSKFDLLELFIPYLSPVVIIRSVNTTLNMLNNSIIEYKRGIEAISGSIDGLFVQRPTEDTYTACDFDFFGEYRGDPADKASAVMNLRASHSTQGSNPTYRTELSLFAAGHSLAMYNDLIQSAEKLISDILAFKRKHSDTFNPAVTSTHVMGSLTVENGRAQSLSSAGSLNNPSARIVAQSLTSAINGQSTTVMQLEFRDEFNPNSSMTSNQL